MFGTIFISVSLFKMFLTKCVILCAIVNSVRSDFHTQHNLQDFLGTPTNVRNIQDKTSRDKLRHIRFRRESEIEPGSGLEPENNVIDESGQLGSSDTQDVTVEPNNGNALFWEMFPLGDAQRCISLLHAMYNKDVKVLYSSIIYSLKITKMQLSSY